MIEILSPNDLCSSILMIKNKKGKENISNNINITKHQEILNEKLSNSQLKEIQKQLNKNVPFDQVLKPYYYLLNFSIPDYSDLFESYLSILNSYLFLSVNYSQLDVKKSIHLLESINHFLSIAPKSRKINRKQLQLISSAFYNLYMCCLSQISKTCKNPILIEYIDIGKYECIIPVVCDFFMKPHLIENERYFEMLSATFKYIVNPNEKHFHPLQAQFITFIDSLILEIGSQFPIETLKSILHLCCGAITGLDPTAIVFLYHLIGIIEIDSIDIFIPLLQISLVSYVEASQKPNMNIVYLENVDDHLKIPLQLTNKVITIKPVNTTIDSNFGKEIDLTNTIEFRDPIESDELFPKSVLSKMNLVEKVIMSENKLFHHFIYLANKYIQTKKHEFSKSVSRKQYDSVYISNYLFDIYSMFIIIIKNVSKFICKYSTPKLSLPIDLLCFLSDNICFDPQITIFNYHDLIEENTWNYINTIRSHSIELILELGQLSLQTFLFNIMIYPYLFAEVIHRLLNLNLDINKNFMIKTDDDVNSIAQTIMTPMIYYQSLDQEYFDSFSNSNEMKNSIITSRKSLILFLNNLLHYHQISSLLFKDEFFCESFLSLLYEQPLRDSVIYPLSNFLSQKDYDTNSPIINKIIKITNVAIKLLCNPNGVDLLDKILSVINKAILINSSFKELFQPLCKDICNESISIIKCEESKSLIYNITQFIAIASNKYEITSPEFIALEKAITNIFENQPNQILFSNIVQLIAGQTLPSLHPSFTIRNPKGLRILLTVFKTSTMINDVFTFIAKLLQYSMKNCEEAHRGEFDIFLIQYLDEYRNDENMPITTFASALSLLMLIASNISSVLVVHSFISLLCPINGKKLPFFQKLLIRSLFSMIPTINKRPLSTLPLSSKTGFNFKGLKGESFQNGLTFSFWIYLNSNEPNYKQQIVMIQDCKDNKCGVFVTSQNIIMLFESGDNQWSSKTDSEIALKTWSFVSLTCYIDNYTGQYRVTSTVNGENGRDLFFPMMQISNGTLKGRIGGISTDSIDVEYPSLIGPVGIFQRLQDEEISFLYELGPCIESVKLKQALAYFVPVENSGFLSIKNTISDDDITILSDPIRYFHPSSFSDILISKCGVSIILPLFAQWNMKFSNGQIFENVASITLTILENLMILNENCQKVFYEENGFKILSHIMMESNGEFLNYALYTQIYNMHNAIANENLKIQLFDNILLNIELWMKCDSENHRRIVRHWDKVLFQTCKEKFVSLRPVSWILNALRVYYWYKPIEIGVIYDSKRFNNKKLNVKDCRQSLLHIAKCVSEENFSESDFKLLISHILTCTDQDQIIDLLNFLHDMIKTQKDLLMQINSSIHIISLLQYLFNINNSSIICATLSIIIEAHNQGLYSNENSFSISNHVDIILHQIVPQFINKSMLTQLINLAIENSEVFPICTWVAMNIGDSGIRMVLKMITPNDAYAKNEYWALYLTVALYDANEKLRRYLSRFLVKCSYSSTTHAINKQAIITFFSTIEVIGRALEQDSDEIKHIVLIEYGKIIERESLPFEEYLKLVKHFLFYRINRYFDENLKMLFNISPFSNSQKPKIPHTSFLIPPQHSNMNQRTNSPVKSQNQMKSGKQRSRRRTSRHSLKPNDILECDSQERYSPLLAQKALEYLNPVQQKIELIDSFRTRRTSMLTVNTKKSIAGFNIESDSLNFIKPETYNVRMMPSQLDKKITEAAKQEFKFSFGLRLGAYQEWKDIDLAEQAFNLFCNGNNPEFDDTKYLITAFLSIWKPDILNKLNQSNHMYYLLQRYSLNNKCSKNMKEASIEDNKIFKFNLFQTLGSFPKSQLINYNNQNNYENETIFYKINHDLMINELKTGPLRLMKHLIKFQHMNSEIAFDIFSMISNEIIALSSNEIADFLDMIGVKKSYNSKLWKHFWNYSTFDRAPWHRSLSNQYIKQQHFKRDDSACYMFCPMKLKQNKKFNDHMDATILRKTGNYQNAKDIYDNYKKKLEKYYAENAPTQLLEVIEDQDFEVSTDSSTEIKKLTKCVIELPCELIHVNGKKKAKFSLLTDSIVITKEKNKKIIIINNDQVSNILFRTYLQHPTAIEIFTTSGNSFFINFYEVNSLPILKSFTYLNLPHLQLFQNNGNFSVFFNNLQITKKWIYRKITNFEYLMFLNILSGRSFNDSSQYPIMPWIIQDYTSNKLDLSNPNTFRDFSKPIGALTIERIEELKKRVYSLQQFESDGYLYSSGPINPLSLYLYLLRVEPFTSLHIEIQNGRFDHTSRLFNSIPTAFKLCTTMMNDYRELIPEFFYSTEFLVNQNHFNFGSPNGINPDEVELPNWASTPYEFIYLHRKALESEYVSSNLQKWIDLIWGDKQKGQKAMDSNNVYMSSMYEDIWEKDDNIKRPETRAQIEAILTHVGQIPHQLFSNPHPSRIKLNKDEELIKNPIIYTVYSTPNNANNILKIITSKFKYNLVSRKLKVFTISSNSNCYLSVFDLENVKRNSKKQAHYIDNKKEVHNKSKFGRSYSNGNYIANLSEDPLQTPQYTPDSFIVSKPIKQFTDIFGTYYKKTNTKQTDILMNDESLLVISNNERSELHRIHFVSSSAITSLNNNDTLYIQQSDNIICIASDGEWLATANDNAVVSLYNIHELQGKPKYIFPSYTSSINCMSINSSFHTIVCGTRDGYLLFCSLTHGTITKLVNIKGRPSSILITPKWGFVVVHSTVIQEGKLIHKILLYTINGDLIKATDDISNVSSNTYSVTSWSSFSDSKGFDYIIFANEKNECYLAEAFYIEQISQPFYQSPNLISSLSYLYEEKIATVLQNNGNLIFIPLEC